MFFVTGKKNSNSTYPRNELGHRYYREEEIQLLHCIKELKNKGFQLKAVKEVLPDLEQKKLIDIHKLLTTQEELENQELEEAQKEAEQQRDSQTEREMQRGKERQNGKENEQQRNSKVYFPKKMTEILLKIVQATTKKAGQTIEILTEITTVPTAMEL